MSALAGTFCILLALSMLLASRILPVLALFGVLVGILGVAILVESGHDGDET